jgi:hypothetical protein
MVASSGESSTAPTAPAYSATTTYAANQTFSYNGATITVTSPGIGVASTKADSACDTYDIALWQPGTGNIQVWAACNVGATTSVGYDTVPLQSPNPTASSTLPPNRVANVQGNYYQWGRNDNVTSGANGGSFDGAGSWNTQLPSTNTTGNSIFYRGNHANFN